MFDAVRNPYNVTAQELRANDTAAETTSTDNMDLVSGGIKMRSSGGLNNDTGRDPYVYIAIGTPIIDVDGRIIAGR
jgi:hypothetical protein